MEKNKETQLKEITVKDVKNLINKLDPEKFEKIIIDDNEKILRADYYHSVYSAKVAFREKHEIIIPLFENVKDFFTQYTNKENKKKKFIYISQNDIKNLLSFHGANKYSSGFKKIPKELDLPFDETDDDILDNQRPYYIPTETLTQTCAKCSGEKYVTCPSCNGIHKWECPDCKGRGRIMCENCDGSGFLRCGRCGGSGTYTDYYYVNNERRYKTVTCSSCGGSGRRGCRICNTSGTITCETCNGIGIITCEHCYGDMKKYGMVDCPECQTAGETANFTYYGTEINILSEDKIFLKGKKLSIDKKLIEKHSDDNMELKTIYKNINGKISTEGEDDEIVIEFTGKHQNNLAIQKQEYPLIIQEDHNYEIIPCIKIKYKHLLTQKTHELTIIDFWDNPEIVYNTDPENISKDSFFKNVSNKTQELFGHIFKTQNYTNKKDQQTKIKLMLYLAKADNKITEDEKVFITDKIESFDIFTNNEKIDLFNILNEKTNDLPELTKNDIKFTNKEDATEFIKILNELALADDFFSPEEKSLIDKIEELINVKYK